MKQGELAGLKVVGGDKDYQENAIKLGIKNNGFSTFLVIRNEIHRNDEKVSIKAVSTARKCTESTLVS